MTDSRTLEAWYDSLTSIDAELLTAVALFVGLVILFTAVLAPRFRRMAAIQRERTPAFDAPISMAGLQSDPGPTAAKLEGLIRAVVVVDVRVGGEDPETIAQSHYTSFVIDTNGETHDLETGPNADEVVENAVWAAQLFSVPLRNETLGHPESFARTDLARDAGADEFENGLTRRRWVLAGVLFAIGTASGAGTWAFTNWVKVQYEGELVAFRARQRAREEAIDRLPVEDRAAAFPLLSEPEPTQPDGIPITELGIFCASMFGMGGVATLRRR